MIAICVNCGKEYKTKPAFYKRSKTHCCSTKCRKDFMAKKNQKTCHQCGKVFISNKKNIFCSIECYKKSMTGDKNQNWRGGASVDKKTYLRERHHAKTTKDEHRARGALYYAIKTGKINRMPCEICGSDKVDAHHSDYSKPLDVRWLCRKHHKMLHAGIIE